MTFLPPFHEAKIEQHFFVSFFVTLVIQSWAAPTHAYLYKCTIKNYAKRKSSQPQEKNRYGTR